MLKLTKLLSHLSILFFSLFWTIKTYAAEHQIDVLLAKDAVCDQVREQLRVDRTVYQDTLFENAEPASIIWPYWQSYQDALSDRSERPIKIWPIWHRPEAASALIYDERAVQVSEFDFDNDNKIDRVSIYYFSTNYHLGTDLLVESGRSLTHLDVVPVNKSTILESTGSSLFPCQWDQSKIALSNCPELSQSHDEAGFGITGLDKHNLKMTVRFRSRYTTVQPIQFKSAAGMMRTYMVLTGLKHAFIGVIEPMHKRKFKPMCLFRTDQP